MLSEAEEQERLDYIFQHNYNRVEQAAGRLGKKRGKFSTKISYKKGEGMRSSYTVPDDDATMEFALAIANFALTEGPYSIDKWLKFLRSLGGEQHSTEFDKMEKALETIRRGSVDLTRNNEKITAYKAYETMAKQVIFASDIDAEAYLQELVKEGPVYHLMFSMYHGYCIDLWRLLHSVHGYRKQHSIRPKAVDRENICIYCNTKEGVFDHVEHTLPESLGNEGSFLPKGFVCGKCKIALDKLEDGISEMVPFSLILLTTSHGNKKGKLPSLRSREFQMEKKSPNRIVFNSHSKKDKIKPEPAEGGGFKFQLKFGGRFEAHKIARMLYKGALGAIALEKGRDVVLNTQFDSVRKYIIEGGTFPNKMIVFRESKPSSLIQATFQEVDGVPVVGFEVLGMIFMIVLGEKPKINPVEMMKPHILVYDLSLEKPESAVEQVNMPESGDSKE